jgi:hypothetical protein
MFGEEDNEGSEDSDSPETNSDNYISSLAFDTKVESRNLQTHN